VDLREEASQWRDRALRLQAEMENFRKRQRRIADDQVQAERERLLRAFLKIADDIDRALGAADADPAALRQGVEIINRALTQVLEQQSVRRLEAKGKVFDPNLHEAISILDSGEGHPEPIVLEVIEAGYEIGDRLLRPAKVVVAK
jgi:molecular chaperone GrpE